MSLSNSGMNSWGPTRLPDKYDQYGHANWNNSQQHQNAQQDFEHDPTSVSPTQSAMYYRNPPQQTQQPYGRAQHGLSTDSTGAVQSRMRSSSNASSLASGHYSYSTSPQGHPHQFSNGYQNQHQYSPTNKGHSSILSTNSQSWSQQMNQQQFPYSSQTQADNISSNVSNPISVRARSGSNTSTAPAPPARPPRPSEELNLDLFQKGHPAGGAHDHTQHHPHHYPQQDYFGAHGFTQQQVEQQATGYRPTYQSRSSSLVGSASYLYQADQEQQEQQQQQQQHSRLPRFSNDIPSNHQSPPEERMSMDSSLRSSGSGRRGIGSDSHPHHAAGTAVENGQLHSIDQYEEMLQKIASPPLGPSSGRSGQRRTEQDRNASRAARQARKQQQQTRPHPDLILEAADEASYLDREAMPVPRARSPTLLSSSLSPEERKQRRRSSLPAALRTSPVPKAVEDLKRRSSGGISPQETSKTMDLRFNNDGFAAGTQETSASYNSNRSSDQRRSWEVESVVARSDIIDGLERTSSWRRRPDPAETKPPPGIQGILADDIYGGTTDTTTSYISPPPPHTATATTAPTHRKNSWDEGMLDNGPVANDANSNVEFSGLSLPPRGPLPPIMPSRPSASSSLNSSDIRRKTSTGSVASVKNLMARGGDYRNSADMKRHLLHAAAEEDLTDVSSTQSASRRESQQLYDATTGSGHAGRSSSRTSMRSGQFTYVGDDILTAQQQQQQQRGQSPRLPPANGPKSNITPPQKSHLRNSYTLTPPSPEEDGIVQPFSTPTPPFNEEQERTHMSMGNTVTTKAAAHVSEEEEPMTPVSAPISVAVMTPVAANGDSPIIAPAATAAAHEDDDEIRQFQLQLEQLNNSSAPTTRSSSGGRRSREEARTRHARHEESNTAAATTASAAGRVIPEEDESSSFDTNDQQPKSPSSPTLPRLPLTPTSRSTTPTLRHRPSTPNSMNGNIIRPPPGPTPLNAGSSPVMTARKTATTASSRPMMRSPPTSANIPLPPPPLATPPSSANASSNNLSAPLPTISGGATRSRAGSTASVASVASLDRNLLATTPPPSSPLPSLPPPPTVSPMQPPLPPPQSAATANSASARRARKMSLANNSKELQLQSPNGGDGSGPVTIDSELAALAGDLASVPLPPLPPPSANASTPSSPLPPPGPPPVATTPSSSSKSLRHRDRTHDRDSNASVISVTSPTTSPQQVARLKQRVQTLEKELETAEHEMSSKLRDSADLKLQMNELVQQRDSLMARVATLEEEKENRQGHPSKGHGDDNGNSNNKDGHDDTNSSLTNMRVSTLELELETLQQTLTEQERELHLAHEDKARLQDELAGLQEHIASLPSAHDHPSAAREENDDALRHQVEQLQAQLQALQTERASEQAMRLDLERQLDQAKARAEQEEVQYRALQESLHRQSLTSSTRLEKKHAEELDELRQQHQQLLDKMVSDHADALSRLAIEHEEETRRGMEKLKDELEIMEQQLAVHKQVQQEIQSQVQRDGLLMEKERDEARWRAKFLQSKVEEQAAQMDRLEAHLEDYSKQAQAWEDDREMWSVREQELEQQLRVAELKHQRQLREHQRLVRVVQMLDLSAVLALREETAEEQKDDDEDYLDEAAVRGAFEKQRLAWQAQIRSLERRLAKAEQEVAEGFESNLRKLVGLEYSPLDTQQEDTSV